MILFIVSDYLSAHVLTYALNREAAKRNAQKWLVGDMDKYTVTPLTSPGDPIKLDITLYI